MKTLILSSLAVVTLAFISGSASEPTHSTTTTDTQTK